MSDESRNPPARPATDAIRRFVRDTLGCTCPEQVFEHVEQTRCAVPDEFTPYALRLVVGRRLLIYVLHGVHAAALQALLPVMLARGIAERDRDGLNRFRAVLACDDQQSLQAQLDELARPVLHSDDRVHLHVVAPEEIIGLPGNVSTAGKQQ